MGEKVIVVALTESEADGIRRWSFVGKGNMKLHPLNTAGFQPDPDGALVRFSDVQAHLERLERYEQAEAELLSGWDRAGLPPEPEVPNGDDEYVWSLRERLSYLLYLSNPAVAVEERTKGLQARLEAADRLAEAVEAMLLVEDGVAMGMVGSDEMIARAESALSEYREAVGKDQEAA